MYTLLISIDVVEFVERLPRRLRLGIRGVIKGIEEDPLGISEASDYDSTGRLVHILVIGDYALTYWIDDTDKHVKVLDIHSADC